MASKKDKRLEQQVERLLSEVEQLKGRLDARERGSHTLEARRQVHLDAGKAPERITYGMLLEGFQSISGIPDEFMSAEDPADRIRLWNERTQGYHKPCDCGGSCSSCDPMYKD